MESSTSAVALMIGPKNSLDLEHLGVKPAKACKMLDCGTTRLYELLNSQELVSYKDGRSRKILVESIKNYIRRQVEKSTMSAG